MRLNCNLKRPKLSAVLVELKLKSHILEGLAEEIIKHKAYPTDNDLNDVAEALVKEPPCLREQGSFNGCYGWKISLKYKLANFRTKLRGLGCYEVTINSLKNKAQDTFQAALNMKKPRRAEVNYCPQHPKGETTDTLENQRIALLPEIKKRNNGHRVTEKMEKTDECFSYRRQEVPQGQPLVADFKSRWPALFTQNEMDKEFMLISTVPLLSTFFAELDRHSPRMMEIFRCKGRAAGRKMRHLMVAISRVCIKMGRPLLIKYFLCPCIYCHTSQNIDTGANTSMGQTVMGVCVIQKVGAEPEDEPEDIGVLIEDVEVLSGLGNIAIACALLFGLIYCLNLSYPPELKCTFEVLQKILLNLDGQRLSSKAQFLKNKLLQ
ncbi:uncharacterized protein LOC118116450 isoform X1 [Hippoglossus stenolepis]|uniref:uncharacterized protein LOC118116450 isoform X1 n=1 Tax=Hippoglossus stenolepis TaxID=195615 RepID=UPI001FAEC859|nr:uncharacterized protein LOC118116450 isoform X1 [Hippoglossus stenolepis]